MTHFLKNSIVFLIVCTALCSCKGEMDDSKPSGSTRRDGKQSMSVEFSNLSSNKNLQLSAMLSPDKEVINIEIINLTTKLYVFDTRLVSFVVRSGGKEIEIGRLAIEELGALDTILIDRLSPSSILSIYMKTSFWIPDKSNLNGVVTVTLLPPDKSLYYSSYDAKEFDRFFANHALAKPVSCLLLFKESN